MSTQEQIIAYCKTNRFFKSIPDLEDNVAAWIDAYQVNILKELKGLNAWLLADKKRQHLKNFGSFIDRNLNHAADRKARPRPLALEITQKLARGMTLAPPPRSGPRLQSSARADPERSRRRETPGPIDYAARRRELAARAKKLGLKWEDN